jgi:hypothetical protein
MANNEQQGGEDDDDGHHHSTPNRRGVGTGSNRGGDVEDDNDGDEKTVNCEGTRRRRTAREQQGDTAPTPPASRPPT